MKFEISEENQRKFNIVLGILFVVFNAVGIPLTIVSENGKSYNQPFGISEDCNEQIRHEPSELVSQDCVDELQEVKDKVTRIKKRIDDARRNF